MLKGFNNNDFDFGLDEDFEIIDLNSKESVTKNQQKELDKDIWFDVINAKEIFQIICSLLVIIFCLFVYISIITNGISEKAKNEKKYKSCIKMDYNVYLNNNLIGEELEKNIDLLDYDVIFDDDMKKVYLNIKQNNNNSGFFLFYLFSIFR